MDNIAPEIFRQRFLVEGYYQTGLDADKVAEFLKGLASALDLTTYGEPLVYSPQGKGREENQGFDAFVPLVDSGISAYFWTGQGFFSVVIYSCSSFQGEAALDFCRDFLEVASPMASRAF